LIREEDERWRCQVLNSRAECAGQDGQRPFPNSVPDRNTFSLVGSNDADVDSNAGGSNAQLDVLPTHSQHRREERGKTFSEYLRLKGGHLTSKDQLKGDLGSKRFSWRLWCEGRKC